MIQTILMLAIVLLIILSAIVGIWQFFVYVGLSWARRRNSKDYTGVDNASAIFEELGDNISVKSAFWSFTYVDYNKNQKRLKLGLVDSRRRSLWTVATTGRQAYSAHIIERASQGEQPPINVFWFKLQTFWFGMMMSALFYFLMIGSMVMWSTAAVDTGNVVNASLFILIGVLFTFPILLATASYKTSKVMLADIDRIFGNIYTPDEVNKIRKLWRLEYIKSIMDLISLVLYLVLAFLKLLASSKKD